MKERQSLKKGIAILVLLTAIGLPLACTTNNSSAPTSPGLPTHTPTVGGPTATPTTTLVPGSTATFTPIPTATATFVVTPVYDSTGGLSFQPNSFYSVPGSPAMVIGEGEVTEGGVSSMIEYYTVGQTDANPNGNEGWTGYPTPGEQAVSYVSHSAGFVLSNPQGLAESNGYWVTLDSPGAIGAAGNPVLYLGDGNIASSPGLFQLPMENHTSSYGGTPLKSPRSLAADSNGNFYVADTGQKRIDEYINDIYNTNVPEYEVYSWTGSNNYKFKNPVAVACDLSDNIYVGDTATSISGPSVVQEYSAGLTIMGTWTLISNCFINGLVVDGNGDFYVSDIGNGAGAAGQVEEYKIIDSSHATLLRAWTVPSSGYEAGLFFPGPIALIGNASLTTITNIVVGDQNTNTVRVFGP